MTFTPYHAKYFAHDLTRRASSGLDRLSMSLFDAAVDLNPHQIEAALFALESPLSKGVVLADEVGLGKTIEAGIVLCQFWAERKRRLLVLCPASLRKQWALEMEEKFNLPTLVLDAKAYREAQRGGRAPLSEKALADTKEQIKALRRQARQAVTLEEQHEIQAKIQKLEKQQRRQRQDIFKAEDEIMEKRDGLIESLERRLAQKTETERLFTIRWTVE